MRKLTLVLFVAVCCMSFIVSAYADTLKKGETVYVRSNLRPDGGKIYYHNMSGFSKVIPAGTEVKIRETRATSGGAIVFTRIDTNKKYTLVANSKQWDKFFVKDKKEIGLDTFSSDNKEKVEKSGVSIGMTKEEVYASKGCPAYTAWGYATEKSDLANIMQSNKWYYMASSRGHDVMVTFENGVVSKIGVFAK